MAILNKPVLTEKATAQSEKLNRYTFRVCSSANKIEIKQAVEAMYGVTVVNVNTINKQGKTKVRYTKSGLMVGNTGDYKKAYVTLKEGDSIDFFNNI